MNIALVNTIPKRYQDVFEEIDPTDSHFIEVNSVDEFCFFNAAHYDFVIVNADVFVANLPGVVQKIKRAYFRSKILIYGHMDTTLTIQLMRGGVDFCFSEKIHPDQLKEYLIKSGQSGSKINQNVHKHRWFVGESIAIRALKHSLNEAIASNKYILITGQPGTGKTNMARIIHECGPLRHAQYKRINLSTYDREYLEDQFWITFRNLFEEVDSDVDGYTDPLAGSIYIEHVEEQPLDFITSLFSMIEQRYYKTLQAGTVLAPRIILPWGLNFDFLQRIPNLRNYFYELELPSLMDRKEDIPILVYTLVEKYSEKHARPIRNMSFEAFNLMLNYNWPGNILELQSVIESAVLNAVNGEIGLKDIGIVPSMLFQVARQNVLGMYVPLNISLQKFQQSLLNAVIETSGQDLDLAAAFLGLNKSELFNKIRLLNISSKI